MRWVCSYVLPVFERWLLIVGLARGATAQRSGRQLVLVVLERIEQLLRFVFCHLAGFPAFADRVGRFAGLRSPTVRYFRLTSRRLLVSGVWRLGFGWVRTTVLRLVRLLLI